MDNDWKNGYKWSRDYRRLKELLDAGYEVVCMADYVYFNKTQDREICLARKQVFSKSEYTRYAFLTMGVTYFDFPIWREKQCSFEGWASKRNLEFIDIIQNDNNL